MKKKIFKILGNFLVILLCFANTVFANDSISVAVSATIPAIPGVNAPPFEGKDATISKFTERNDETAIAIENPKQAVNNRSPENIQQETLRQTDLGAVTVNTIYSR